MNPVPKTKHLPDAPWLGEVPAHWEVKPLFTVLRETDERNRGVNEQNLLSLSYGRIVRKDISTVEGLLPESFDTYQIVEPGDIVLRLTDLQNDQRSLRVGLVPERGIITSAYVNLRPRLEHDPRFLFYQLHNIDLRKVFYSLGGGVRQSMKYEELKRLPILLPPIEQQLAIADFLDQETRRIDVLLQKQRQLSLLVDEQLNSETSAIITGHSKGSKKTGVEWMGSLPNTWDVVPLGRIAALMETGPFGSQLHAQDYESGGTPVINPAHIENGSIVADENSAVGSEAAARLERHAFRVGDLVVARRGEVGRCAMVTAEQVGWLCGTGSMKVRLKPGHCPEYFSLLLQTPGPLEQLLLHSVGSTMPNINPTILSRLLVPVPPLAEEIEIVALVQALRRRAASIKRKVNDAVVQEKEYREAILSAAVTGGIDVRTYRPQEATAVCQ